jgi:hypothetical protein
LLVRVKIFQMLKLRLSLWTLWQNRMFTEFCRAKLCYITPFQVPYQHFDWRPRQLTTVFWPWFFFHCHGTVAKPNAVLWLKMSCQPKSICIDARTNALNCRQK